MTTGIRGCENKSDNTVSVINVEHPGDSAVISAKSYSDVYAWISQHKNTPLSVQTKKGTCFIWDENWGVRGQWVGDSNVVLLAECDFTHKLEIFVKHIVASHVDWERFYRLLA